MEYWEVPLFLSLFGLSVTIASNSHILLLRRETCDFIASTCVLIIQMCFFYTVSPTAGLDLFKFYIFSFFSTKFPYGKEGKAQDA